MRVAAIMHKNVRCISPDATVSEAVQAMAEAHVSGLPVVDSAGRVVGVVTSSDILEAEAEHTDAEEREDLFENTVIRDLMTPQVHLILPTDDVREAAKRMLYLEVRRLFVEENGRLVGVISATDIAQAVGTGKLL